MHRSITLMSLTLMAAAQAAAVDFTFVGGPEGEWNDMANWQYWDGSGNVPAISLPGSGDTTIFNGTVSALYSSGDQTIMNMQLGRDGGGDVSLRITGGKLTVTEDFIIGAKPWWASEAGNGTLYVDGGQLDVQRHMRVGDHGAGHLVITAGTINIAGALSVPSVENTSSPDRSGRIDLVGGVINADTLALKGWDETPVMGRIDIQGGTLHIVQNEDWRVDEIRSWVAGGYITAYGNASLDPSENHVVVTKDNQGIWVTAVMVPEPAAIGVLGFAAAMGLRRRRA